jgi:hypothetical protein
MFINPSLRLNNAISNVLLDTSNNELYENGIRVATQTDIDFLQQEINSFIPDNPNGWINSDGITSTIQRIPFTDGTPNGMTTSQSLTFGIDPQTNPTLTVGGTQMISQNNDMFLRSANNIETGNNMILKGPASIQTSFQHGTNNSNEYVKTYVDKDNFNFITDNEIGSATEFKGASQYFFDNNIITSQNVIINQGNSLTLNNDTDVNNVKLYKQNGLNGNFVLDNQTGSKTEFKNASEYYFDNNVNIGDLSTSKTLTLNGVPITPSGGGLSAGLQRALNINQIVPTVAQTYDVVWSNLSPAEQAIWVGGSEPPTASATGNYWNFTKLSAGTQKINWTLPFDFLTANLKFQEIQSVYAIVRLNTSSNISQEGYMWFQIQSQNTVPDPPNFKTRWNYANSASGVISQLGNTYKIYASDAIPLSTAASNTGKGQEPYPLQSQFKSNPVDVEPTSLFSIPFSKFVGSPSGDTSLGYTSAFVQSIALNTASNINTYNFDLIAIGFNSVRYNLFFAP